MRHCKWLAITLIFLIFLSAICTNIAYSALGAVGCRSFSGQLDSLDRVPFTKYEDGTNAIVFIDGDLVYFYQYNSTFAAASSNIPEYVVPEDNTSGTGAWTRIRASEIESDVPPGDGNYFRTYGSWELFDIPQDGTSGTNWYISDDISLSSEVGSGGDFIFDTTTSDVYRKDDATYEVSPSLVDANVTTICSGVTGCSYVFSSVEGENVNSTNITTSSIRFVFDSGKAISKISLSTYNVGKMHFEGSTDGYNWETVEIVNPANEGWGVNTVEFVNNDKFVEYRIRVTALFSGISSDWRIKGLQGWTVNSWAWRLVDNLKGVDGNIGIDGLNGKSTLFGTGVPAPTLGNNLDIYVDGSTNDLYYKDDVSDGNINYFIDNAGASASTENSSYSAWAYRALEGRLGDWRSNVGALPAWWKYDFGEGVGQVIDKIVISSYQNYLKNVIIQGSNNNTNWTDLATYSFPNTNNTTATIEFNNDVAYRYIRIYFEDSWHTLVGSPLIKAYSTKNLTWRLVGNIKGKDGEHGKTIFSGSGVPNQLLGAHFDFYLDTDTLDLYKKNDPISGATNLFTVDANTSASNNVTGRYPAYALEAYSSNRWQSTAPPQWWKYDFGEGIKYAVNRIVLTQYLTYNKDIIIQGSNDDTIWTDLATYSFPDTSGFTADIEFDNDVEYRYIRVYVETSWVTASAIATIKAYAPDDYDWRIVSNLKGEDGVVGSDGKDGKTMHSGSGVPIQTFGNAYEFYLDEDTLSLYKKSLGIYGSNLFTDTAAASASTFGGGWEPWRALVAQAGTWITTAAAPQWWMYDFGEGVAHNVNRVTMTRYQTRATDIIIQGSNNNSDWTNLTSHTFTISGESVDLEFENEIEYRYIRVYVETSAVSTVCIENIAAYKSGSYDWKIVGHLKGADGIDGSAILSGSGVPNSLIGNYSDFYIDTDTFDVYAKNDIVPGTINHFTGGTATASIYDSSYIPANAFDTLSNTFWYTTSASAAWLKYDFGEGIEYAVSQIKVWPGKNGDDLRFKNFIVEGSNNDFSWTYLTSGILPSNVDQFHYIDFFNEDTYRYIKITVLDSYNGTTKEVRQCEAYSLDTLNWQLVGNIKGDKGDIGDVGPAGTSWISGEDTPNIEIGRPDDFYLSHSDYEIYKKDTTVYSTDLCTDGTASASGSYDVFTPDFAFDGNMYNSWWEAPLATFPSWIQYTFLEVKNVKRIVIYPSSGYPGRSPGSVDVYGSSTGSFSGEEVLIESFVDVAYTDLTPTILALDDNDTLYLAYRLVCNSSADGLNEYLRIGEIELLSSDITWGSIGNIKGVPGADAKTVISGNGSPSFSTGNDFDFYIDKDTLDMYHKSEGAYGLNLFTNAANASASTVYNLYATSSAIDGNFATTWMALTTTNEWWKYDFGEGNAHAISKISITRWSNGLKDMVVQGSNNDSDWTDLVTYSFPAIPFEYEVDLEFENSTEYRFIRVYIFNGYTTRVGITEISAHVSGSYDWKLITNIKGEDAPIIHSGSGAPAVDLGNDFDFYIDNATLDFYRKNDPTSGVVNLFTNKYSASSQDHVSNNWPSLVIDGESGFFRVATLTEPKWWQYDFGPFEKHAINTIEITRTLSYARNLVIQGSNDGINFTELGTGLFESEISSPENDFKIFTFDNDVEYRYIRIVFLDSYLTDTRIESIRAYAPDSYTWQIINNLAGSPVIPADGADGTDGQDGKTILYGSGAPATELSTPFNYYLDMDTYNLYCKNNTTYGPNLFTEINNESSSSYYSANFPWLSIDGSLTSEWISASGTNEWWKYDFGEGNAHAISKITIYQYSGNIIKDFIIQGSNNDTDWTNLMFYSFNRFPITHTYELEFSNEIEYRYIRVYIVNSNTTRAGIAEITAHVSGSYDWKLITNIKGSEDAPIIHSGSGAPAVDLGNDFDFYIDNATLDFYRKNDPTSGVVNLFTNRTSTSTSNYSSSNYPSNPIDDNTSYWASSALGETWTYDMGVDNTKAVNKVEITRGHGYTKNVIIKGSNDGVNLTNLGTGLFESNVSSAENNTRIFEFENNIVYRYIHIQTIDSWTSVPRLMRIKAYAPDSYDWQVISNLKGDTGPIGPTSVLLTGEGDPSNSIGTEIDKYIDIQSGNLYNKTKLSDIDILEDGTPITGTSSLTFDLGEDNEKVLRLSRILPLGEDTLTDYTILGSMDSTNWTELVSVTGNTSITWIEDEIDSTSAYRYVRIDCTLASEGFGVQSWELYENTYIWDFENNIWPDDTVVTGKALSADPVDPIDGEWVMWMSDGTGAGDAGDILIKVNSGGSIKTKTILDFDATD